MKLKKILAFSLPILAVSFVPLIAISCSNASRKQKVINKFEALAKEYENDPQYVQIIKPLMDVIIEQIKIIPEEKFTKEEYDMFLKKFDEFKKQIETMKKTMEKIN